MAEPYSVAFAARRRWLHCALNRRTDSRGVANGLNLLVLRMVQRQTCCRGDRGCLIEGNGHPLEVRTSEGTKYHQLTTCR